MQERMKKYPLSEKEVGTLMAEEKVGRFATTGNDGYPYVIPVHFVFEDNTVYIHGRAAGEKLVNVKNNPLVGFEVETMRSLIQDEQPCNTNTEFQSVVIKGKASLVDDPAKKRAVLDAVIAKYTPQHIGEEYPEKILRMTAIIAIRVDFITGKYYPAAQG